MKNRERILSPYSEKKLDEIKLQLCECIKRAVLRQGWTQTVAASRMGTSRTRLNLVNRLQTKRLSMELLFRFLVVADSDIKVLVALRR